MVVQQNILNKKNASKDATVRLQKKIKIGDICAVKITAIGPNQVGIDEYSYPYSILVPNTHIGDNVKAKIVKIQVNGPMKFAIAKPITSQKTLQSNKNSATLITKESVKTEKSNILLPNIKVGDILNVPILRIGSKHVVANLPVSVSSAAGSPSGVDVNPATALLEKAEEMRLPEGHGHTELKGYKLFILMPETGLNMSMLQAKSKEAVEVQITRVKAKYAFAQFTSKLRKSLNTFPNVGVLGSNQINSSFWSPSGTALQGKKANQLLQLQKWQTLSSNFYKNTNSKKQNNELVFKLSNLDSNGLISKTKPNVSSNLLKEGNKLTVVLPKNVKKYACLPNHVMLKLDNTFLFIKLSLGAVLGDKVKIKLMKVVRAVNALNNIKKTPLQFAIAKIVNVNPISLKKKRILVKSNVREMLKSGMHFGEKAIKCHATMKNYIWLKQKRTLKYGRDSVFPYAQDSKNKQGVDGLSAQNFALNHNSLSSKPMPMPMPFGQGQGQGLMSSETGKLEDAVNKPLIKKGRNIINLLKTSVCLKKSLVQLGKYAAKGRTFLFVGTKKPAAALVARASLFSKTSFFVNTRWLGGMLTNWKTILKSISKIRPILKEKQMIVKEILLKRQNIKSRLIQKALLLRKKSKSLLQKGRTLIKKVVLQQNRKEMSNSKGPGLSSITNGSQAILFLRRKQLIEKGQSLLQTRAQLIDKKNQIMVQSKKMKNQVEQIKNKYKIFINQLITCRKKLIELQFLFAISKQVKGTILQAKTLNMDLVTLSYAKFKNLHLTGVDNNIMVANPPKKILNKIVTIIRSYASLNTSGPSLTKPFYANAAVNNSSEINLGLKAAGTATKIIRKERTFYALARPRRGPKGRARASVELRSKTLSALATPDGTLLPSEQKVQSNTEHNSKKVIIMSKLLNKFSMFVPYIRESISALCSHLTAVMSKISVLKDSLKTIKTSIYQFINLKTKINIELNKINSTLLYERSVIKVVKRKLKQLNSEARLIKFLPKLRFLSTPKNKIYNTVQVLMRKIVDPKLKYPIDTIYDQKLSLKSKKVVAARKKTWQRLEKYFGGIANMTKMKKNKIYKNVAIIIGQQEELNAVRECKKLGIKMFNIVDTNCNPNLADHFIPANDDSRNSIKYILTKFLTRIRLAQKISVKIKRVKPLSSRTVGFKKRK